MTHVNCPKCGQRLHLPPIQEKQGVRCPACKHEFVVSPHSQPQPLPRHESSGSPQQKPTVTIVRCPECEQKLRLLYLPGQLLNVTCQKCRGEFLFSATDFRRKCLRRLFLFLAGLLGLVAAIAITPVLFTMTSNSMQADLDSAYDQVEDDFIREAAQLNEEHRKQLQGINIGALRDQASQHYASIARERKAYSKKYALTKREKAQLRMRSLSKDKTKHSQEIIAEIAREAAPQGSAINVRATKSGFSLDVEFPMSALSDGEQGSRTKHETIHSLKKEVVSLISQVTSDVFQFCQDIDLEAISLGCRHVVTVSRPDGTTEDRDTTLYKIVLERDDLRELKENPFLKIYSTTEHFKITVDVFLTLDIKETRL